MRTYLCVYLSSVFLALVTTPVVIRLARRLRIVDIPSARNAHVKPTPNIGGVAICFSTTFLTVVVLFSSNAVGEAFQDIRHEAIALLLAAGLIFFIGLVDDVRTKGIRARTKFLAQIVAAIAVCAAGIKIDSVVVTDGFTLSFGFFSWPLTLLWIIGITNAVNLSDGLDGLAAGICAVACGVIAVFAALSGQVVMVVLMLAMLGSLTGFLFFNFNPAKIFMGDCGSMFLGFTIASSSALCAVKSSTLIGLALPVLALGIPIFDILFSMLHRFVERRSMFAPDSKHFHHRLLALGLRETYAVIAIYAMTLLLAGLGVFVMVARDSGSPAVFFCILLLIILMFRVVGSVRLRKTVEGLQRRYAIRRQVQKELTNFQNAVSCFDQASTPDEWWQAVCKGVQYMDFVWLSIGFTDADGSAHTQIWRRAGSKPDLSNVAVLTVPVCGQESTEPMEIEVAIEVGSSLESVCRRAALFSRMVEEYDVVSLLEKRRVSTSFVPGQITSER